MPPQLLVSWRNRRLLRRAPPPRGGHEPASLGQAAFSGESSARQEVTATAVEAPLRATDRSRREACHDRIVRDPAGVGYTVTPLNLDSTRSATSRWTVRIDRCRRRACCAMWS